MGCSRSWSAHGRLWWTALGAERLARSASEEGSYEVLVARAPNMRSVELSLVEKDVGRTFPDRSEFQVGDARARLRRVLSAYALRHTYCQGMSYVAAMLLQHLPEHHAFWALAALVEEFLPDGYFTDDLHGAYMDQHIAFAEFLPYRLPRLAAHLAALEFPLTLIGVRWFLCLFSADIDAESTCAPKPYLEFLLPLLHHPPMHHPFPLHPSPSPAATCGASSSRSPCLLLAVHFLQHAALSCNLWDFLFSHGSHVLFGAALCLLEAAEEELLLKPDVPGNYTWWLPTTCLLPGYPLGATCATIL